MRGLLSYYSYSSEWKRNGGVYAEPTTINLAGAPANCRTDRGAHLLHVRGDHRVLCTPELAACASAGRNAADLQTAMTYSVCDCQVRRSWHRHHWVRLRDGR